jgi:hypothetical protein
MNEHDLLLLKTLVQAHGLSETLSALSAVCSTMAVELAPDCAHRSIAMMSISVQLDALSVEFDDTPAIHHSILQELED